MENQRLKDAEQFVRRALSHFDQPILSDAEIRRAAQKVLDALPSPPQE
jgi:hypothetical protein